MKVALLTMFNGLSPTYSLVNVVAEQLEMLLNHGISVKLLVSEDCPLESRFGIYLAPNIEWIKVINHKEGKRLIWRDYSDPKATLHPDLLKDATLISQDFITHLQDVDFCFLHDILYQGWHYVHNLALRLALPSLPHVKFLAFTHSFPAKRPSTLTAINEARFMPLPQTRYIYPTYAGLMALASQYNVPEGLCHVVSNSLSTLSFLSKEVKTLHRQFNLLDSEFLIVYPGRLTPGKKFEKVVALAGCLYTSGERSVKVIFPDFPSSDIPSDAYKKVIRETATLYGLPQEYLCFTSDYGFQTGFSRTGVLDLFTLSNLFICPSFSESFGLTVLEAASRGNFIILNSNVPALCELGESLHAYFMAWDGKGFESNSLATYPSSEHDYYNSHIKKILSLFYDNPVLFAKTQTRIHYSPDWIFKNQLEPLLTYEELFTY